MYLKTSAHAHPHKRTLTVFSTHVRLQPTTLSSEDAMLLPEEEPGQSEVKPGTPTDQLTPVSVPVLPSTPSASKEGQRPGLESEVPAVLPDWFDVFQPKNCSKSAQADYKKHPKMI